MATPTYPPKEQFDSVTSVGGLVVGDIAVLTAGVLSGALNDTIAHAKVAGVWDGVRLRKRGELALVNFSGTPVVDGTCYLSGTSKLATMTAPTGAVVPREIGTVQALTGANQALVQLSIDIGRDDAKEWLLETYAPTGNANSKVWTINPLLYKRISLRHQRFGGSSSFNFDSLYLTSDAGGDHYYRVANSAIINTDTKAHIHDAGGAAQTYPGTNLTEMYVVGARVVSHSVEMDFPNGNVSPGILVNDIPIWTSSFTTAGRNTDSYRANQTIARLVGRINI